MSQPLSDAGRWMAWDRFLEAAPDTGFMQSSWYADFRACVGYECFGIVLKDEDTIVAGAMVMKWSYTPSSCFYYICEGPVLPRDEDTARQAFELILGIVEKHRRAEPRTVSHLRIEPRWTRLPGFVRGFRPVACRDPYTEPRNTLCIDLRLSEDAILAQMKPKGRYNVRLARRHAVRVIEDTTDKGLTDFMRLYTRTAARQGIERKPRDYFDALLRLLRARDQVSIFFADYSGRRLATALVVYFGARATYFFGGSLVAERRVMAPYLLHFEIMRAAKARGCEWYDLWGVAPESETDHPWRDLSVFKRKFGGVELSFVPTLDFVYDVETYESYVMNTCEPDQPARAPSPGQTPAGVPEEATGAALWAPDG